VAVGCRVFQAGGKRFVLPCPVKAP
jgi:hypothetical protein